MIESYGIVVAVVGIGGLGVGGRGGGLNLQF